MKSKKKVMCYLQKAYSELPDKRKLDIRTKIMARCDISVKSFYRYIANSSKFRTNDHAYIARLFKKPVSELFPK